VLNEGELMNDVSFPERLLYAAFKSRVNGVFRTTKRRKR
jgi:hypothetical protein